MTQIVFTTRLTADDLDAGLRSWRCPALNIPSAIVQDIYVDGNKIDNNHYKVLAGQAMIKWILPTIPEKISVIIELQETLSLNSQTDKWKNRAITYPAFASVLVAIVSGTFSYYASPSKTTERTATELHKASSEVQSVLSELSQSDVEKLLGSASARYYSKGSETTGHSDYSHLFHLGVLEDIPSSELDTNRFGSGTRLTVLGTKVREFILSLTNDLIRQK